MGTACECIDKVGLFMILCTADIKVMRCEKPQLDMQWEIKMVGAWSIASGETSLERLPVVDGEVGPSDLFLERSRGTCLDILTSESL